MTLERILIVGQNQDLPQYINEKIHDTNFLGLIIGILSIPFWFITLIYFPGLIHLISIFTICCFASIFINSLGLYDLSRYLICVGLVCNYTIYHCYLLEDHQPLIASLYCLQMVFWLLPMLLFDVRERVKLFACLTLVVFVSLFIPFLNNYFTMNLNRELFLTGWLSWVFLLGSVSGFVACIYFITNSWSSIIKKNDVLLAEMTLKNEHMQENEKSLNKYILEVEDAHNEEIKRKWAADGHAMFAEILRSSNNVKSLSESVISNLVKFLKVNQGGIFLESEKSQGHLVLSMESCYAYDRKKYLIKEIELGEGLLGQCYLERESIYLNEIPQGYVNITSGLGHSKPNSLLLCPIMTNDIIIGVLEIASFQKLLPYEIEFVEKLAENMASVITSVRLNENTKFLLEQSKLQTEQMRSQEEEMRQNMEELIATQEEMIRKENELQDKSEMMELIVDNIPFPVFIKDELGKYILVNKAEADIFGVSVSEIIGFDDSKFVNNKEEMDAIRNSDKKIVEQNIPVYLPEQTLTLKNGNIKIFKTTKIPFLNKQTGKTNILGVSIDLSDSRKTEEGLQKELDRLKIKFENTIL